MESALPDTLIYPAGIALVLIFALGAALLMQLGSTKIHRPRIQIKQREDLPPWLLKIYDTAIDQLLPLGFTPLHFQLSHELISPNRSEKWEMVLANRKTGVIAEISPATLIINMPGFDVNFWSIAKDGKTLLTVNGNQQAILSEIPGCILHDVITSNVAEQYHAHQEQLAGFREGKKLTLLNPVNYIKLQQKLLDACFLKLMKSGTIVSTGNNQFRLAISPALKMFKQNIISQFSLARHARIRQIKKARLASEKVQIQSESTSDSAVETDNSDSQPSATYPVEAEVAAFMQLRSASNHKTVGMISKLALFIITISLSYLAFGLVFSYSSVLILLGVLLLHELGHVAAMATFRYRDLQILFIPFLGAAATGKHDNVATWKQVIIYLMGPLPGIITGIILIALYHKTQTPLLYETAVIMLIINYINLLPIMPLDGGHIIRLTTMARFPAGKFIFSLFSMALVAGLGLWIDEPVLWVLALFILPTLPLAWRETIVMNEIQKKPATDEADPNATGNSGDNNASAEVLPPQTTDIMQGINDKLTHAFNILRKPRFHKLTFSDKFILLKSMSDVLLQHRQCKIHTSLSLTGFYLVTLLITPPVALLSAVGPEDFVRNLIILSGGTPVRDWEKEINTTADPQHRYKLTLDAAQYYIATRQLSFAEVYLLRAKDRATLTNDNSELSRLFQTYSLYYQRMDKPEKAEQSLQQAINIGVNAAVKDNMLISSHFQALANLKFLQKDAKSYESNLLTALLFSKQIHRLEDRHVIVDITKQLLEVYYQLDQHETAQLLLQQTVNELLPVKDPFNLYIARYLYQQLAWLSDDTGDKAAALKFFQQALQLKLKKPDTQKDTSVTLAEPRGDPLEDANILLAIATIQFGEGQITSAQIKIEQAEKLAIENQFESLGHYIETYYPESVRNMDTDKSRDTVRWGQISDTYHSLRKVSKNRVTG